MKIVTVIRTDDGRYGIENDKDLGAMTMRELDKIVNTFLMWADVHAELIEERKQGKK